jgi:tRNA-specific 2-thiouridylase
VLLKVGRHLRPKPHFKMIIARDGGETRYLDGYRKQFKHLIVRSHSGPMTLIEGEVNEDDIELAAQIVGRYSKGRDAAQLEFDYVDKKASPVKLYVKALTPNEFSEKWAI